MVITGSTSGVVVRFSLPSALEQIRRRHDLAAASGAPAHVTLLFPFLPVAQLEPGVRLELARIAGGIPPFEVRFAKVGRFPGVVYLRPEPAAPFARLTASIMARFPDYRPYGGAYPEILPHLTMTESEVAPLDAIAAAVRRSLPFTRRASAIEVLTDVRAGRWRHHWRIPLGLKP